MFSLNINSLRNKITTLTYYAIPFDPDVTCLCETWLTPYIPTRALCIRGYNLVRNDRCLARKQPSTPDSIEYVRGGGVAI